MVKRLKNYIHENSDYLLRVCVWGTLALLFVLALGAALMGIIQLGYNLVIAPLIGR